MSNKINSFGDAVKVSLERNNKIALRVDEVEAELDEIKNFINEMNSQNNSNVMALDNKIKSSNNKDLDDIANRLKGRLTMIVNEGENPDTVKRITDMKVEYGKIINELSASFNKIKSENKSKRDVYLEQLGSLEKSFLTMEKILLEKISENNNYDDISDISNIVNILKKDSMDLKVELVDAKKLISEGKEIQEKVKQEYKSKFTVLTGSVIGLKNSLDEYNTFKKTVEESSAALNELTEFKRSAKLALKELSSTIETSSKKAIDDISNSNSKNTLNISNILVDLNTLKDSMDLIDRTIKDKKETKLIAQKLLELETKLSEIESPKIEDEEQRDKQLINKINELEIKIKEIASKEEKVEDKEEDKEEKEEKDEEEEEKKLNEKIDDMMSKNAMIIKKDLESKLKELESKIVENESKKESKAEDKSNDEMENKIESLEKKISLMEGKEKYKPFGPSSPKSDSSTASSLSQNKVISNVELARRISELETTSHKELSDKYVFSSKNGGRITIYPGLNGFNNKPTPTTNTISSSSGSICFPHKVTFNEYNCLGNATTKNLNVSGKINNVHLSQYFSGPIHRSNITIKNNGVTSIKIKIDPTVLSDKNLLNCKHLTLTDSDGWNISSFGGTYKWREINGNIEISTSDDFKEGEYKLAVY